ncbi:methyltransferase [Arsenicibacter rosenii]|uniref:tRNA1(Val) (adenine(37)-N6)-methyltransferase n=2 Tax=Arsenicibacter rosenii TaxID=1750698 RepID=A0A1S2VLN9_9BACT|nr:methyltransferase [Arsenicibacter rosenii]
MKVCTDACLLGAYADVANQQAAPRLLDIGTGTGLLALMAAQRNPTARIDAVEIDTDAARQATENAEASPFSDRITIWHTPVQQFNTAPASYDRILTNPPFYTNHLRSPDAAVNRALHTDDLPFGDLLTAVDRLLHRQGQWWVLLPPYEMDQLTQQAVRFGLTPFQRLQVQHHANKPFFRHITGFSFTSQPGTDSTLAIYETDGRTYTATFRSLLQDFYLIF